jgi:hypothetical protein
MSAVTCLLVVVASLPFNIDAGRLTPDLLELMQRSPTFRRQCERIAATRSLRVTVRVVPTIDAGGRAQTTIHRYDAGGLRAEVSVRFSEDYFELLAHEFEHILEQVEGVRLRDEVAAGRAWITPSGAFETRRAARAGVRVRQECEASAAEAVHVGGPKM